MPLQKLFTGLYLAWIATELYVVLVTRTRSGSNSSTISDRGSLRVLWITIVTSITLGMWIGAAYTPTRIHAGTWLGPVTVALMALGLVIRWAAIYTLGRAFSANVAIHATQTLNTSGPFRLARHPSYTGMVIIFVAMGLSTHNWLGLALIVIPPIAALLYRIHVEEAALTVAFGPAYTDYARTTTRLFPGIY
jgi:protein-S-isoprenylcysteine O-methyltransferase Ste14